MNILIMLPILFVIIAVIFFIYKKNIQIKNLPQIKSEIMHPIVNIRVNYVSTKIKKVKNEYEALEVAKEFFEYSKSVNIGTESLYYPNKDFKLKNVSFHGIWEGKKYWKIEADRLEKNPEEYSYNKWETMNIFDVTEDGKVVTFLYGV